MKTAVILVVEDDPLQRRLIRGNLEAEGYAVTEASGGREAIEAQRRTPADVAVIDYKLGQETGLDVIAALQAETPGLTAIIATAFANVENAVAAIRAGAYDYLVKPIDFKKLLLAIERARERHELRTEVHRLKETIGERLNVKNIVFASSRMEEVARLTAKSAASDATVLITGETGTGKELVARTIHASSRRAGGAFVAVNVPSLPETLLEGELFGAEKGAYTGAHERKTGKFEAASGGTLFLDEIGDLPLHLQVKLLRFLQDREFSRLGSTTVLRSDARVVAATNRDLEQAVARGSFRSDLYYRLNVIRIVVPPLRDRREDIPPLVDLFIRRYAERERKPVRGITAEALAALQIRPFPGNVRELENAVERAVVFAEGENIRVEDLPPSVRDIHEAGSAEEAGSLEERVCRLETRAIRGALEAEGGVKARAARVLGITERMLSYKIKNYGLK
jgi:two-component system NtrC family response regulator